jgi:hypothetical protein
MADNVNVITCSSTFIIIIITFANSLLLLLLLFLLRRPFILDSSRLFFFGPVTASAIDRLTDLIDGNERKKKQRYKQQCD